VRGALGPVPDTAVDAVWPDVRQLERCVDGLVTDGLVARVPGPGPDDPVTYRLPAALAVDPNLPDALGGGSYWAAYRLSRSSSSTSAPASLVARSASARLQNPP
jgi:hypothetical protein